MNGRVLAAVLVGSVLAAVLPVPVSAAVPAVPVRVSAAVPAAPVSAAVPAVPARVSAGAPVVPVSAAAPAVPCPREKLSPPPQRPPKPKPPALDPAHAVIGGDALATDGLAIPSGAAIPPKLTASTWLVADLDTGQVLGACNAHGYETPASVQKVLLAATMMPKLDPKQVVQVLREDLEIDRGSSAVGLVEGGKYSVETLWYGLLFDSGNDAANVLARIGGGGKGRAGGVAMMNAQARHLGALQTHAVTPSGLDGPGQFTSAYDLVLIARAAFGLPDFRRYVATKTAKIPPQPPRDPRGFQIQNDNGLLQKYPGALGGKSGFTTLARHSFVGAAKRGDRTLVAAVLGAEARPLRASDQTGKLLDWGFALSPGTSVGRLVEPGELDPKPTPSQDRQAAAAEGAAARPADGIPGSSPAAVVGLTVAVAAVVLVMLLAATRRRAAVRVRRAALTERRTSRDARAPAPGRDARGPVAGRDARGPVAGRDARGPAAGRLGETDGLYRPADPERAPRRGPRPPDGPRPASGRGTPDDYYAPPSAMRGRPDPGDPAARGVPAPRDSAARGVPAPRDPAARGGPRERGGRGGGAERGGHGVPAQRDGREVSAGWQGSAEGYPPPERRPPYDARFTPPGGGRYLPGEAGVDGSRLSPRGARDAPGDRRPRSGEGRGRGPAAPDPYRPPHPDDRWP